MSNETKVTYLPVSAIKVDPACQARAGMNSETINEYAEVMKEGGDDAFPAVVVFHDGADYWLSDGFHRYEAAKIAGLQSLKSRIRQGGRREAILNSVGTNTNHGLRRTNADKRRAVSILLEDEEWSTWSNREIARRCGVDEWLVRKLREEQASVSPTAGKPQTERKVERNGKAYGMETTKIGKKDGVKSRSHQLRVPDKVTQDGDHAEKEPTATHQRVIAGERDETMSPAAEARSSEDAQLQELMSAWSRASEEVRQQFLTTIRASLSPQATADAGLSGSEPFEIWNRLKEDARYYGRQWVEAGCPTELNRFERAPITEKLIPFRRAVKAATRPEREQFLKLAQRHRR
jgi:hypothetical protein